MKPILPKVENILGANPDDQENTSNVSNEVNVKTEVEDTKDFNKDFLGDIGNANRNKKKHR